MSFTSTKEIGEYYHVLSLNEMPQHNHQVFGGIHETSIPTKYGYYPLRLADKIDESNISYTYNSVNSYPHNNIQPSLVVFFWRRTA